MLSSSKCAGFISSCNRSTWLVTSTTSSAPSYNRHRDRGKMASSTKSVPPYATWMYPGVQDSAPSKPRRCIADEIAVCIASLLPCLKPLRVFNGTMPATLECSSVSPGTCVGWILIMIVAFFDAWLRGASQVVVINNPCSGILIIAALFFVSDEIRTRAAPRLTGLLVSV